MKKICSLLLVVFLLFGMTACKSDSNDDTLSFDPGTYSATASSMKGNISVDVEVDDSKILSVNVKDDVDTHGIADPAISSIPKSIVEEQTLSVDTVSGATVTSMAILRAVEKALEEAGANTALLKEKTAQEELEKGADQEYDVVIVGSGASGISAAIKIGASSDLKVLVLEKLAYYGGSSRVCGGGIWAIGSQLNKNVGIDSTEQEYIDFMEMRSETTLNRDLLANVYNISGPTFDYLVDNGLPVDIETPGLSHPDSKLAIAWAKSNAATPYETGYGGKDIMDSMVSIAQKNDVELRTNAKVTSLVVESNGVTGVAVEGLHESYTVHAKKVILATGGFSRNVELIKELAPEYEGVMPFTGAGSTGDGITMTKDLDTVLVGQGMMGLTGVNMNLGYYGEIGGLIWVPQIYVNKSGEQFGMETTFYSETLPLVNNQEDEMCFGIADSTNGSADLFEKAAGPFAAENAADGVVIKADSIEDLAEQLGINKETLVATAQDNNLASAPFYAIKIRPLFIGSIPGLKVTENCQVVNSDGDVVPNLYAVGELTFGNYFNKIYPGSGTGVGTAVYSGAIAGEHIVEDMN